MGRGVCAPPARFQDGGRYASVWVPSSVMEPEAIRSVLGRLAATQSGAAGMVAAGDDHVVILRERVEYALIEAAIADGFPDRAADDLAAVDAWVDEVGAQRTTTPGRIVSMRPPRGKVYEVSRPYYSVPRGELKA